MNSFQSEESGGMSVFGGEGGGGVSLFYESFRQGKTVKSILSGHSKIDKTKILLTNGSLMKAESIAECSPWSILQYF